MKLKTCLNKKLENERENIEFVISVNLRWLYIFKVYKGETEKKESILNDKTQIFLMYNFTILESCIKT